MDLKIETSDRLDKDEVDAFWQMLRDYNASQVGPSGYQTLYIALRDEQNAIKGGLNGATFRGWLQIENLVVHEECRGQGYGSALLTAAEDEARTRGCHSAYLDTFSFQARPFYEKHGYKVFGTLDDFPIGHQCYWLMKRL